MISDIIKSFEEQFEPRNMCGNCVHLNFIKAFLTKALNKVLDDIPVEELDDVVFCACGKLKVPSYEGKIRCPTFDDLDETDIADTKKWRAWYDKHDGASKIGDVGDLRLYQKTKELIEHINNYRK